VEDCAWVVRDIIHHYNYNKPHHSVLLTNQFSEMERDSIIAAGCAYTLYDRMYVNSDPHQVYICKYCCSGSFVHFTQDDVCCSKHGDAAIVKVDMCKGTKVLLDEMMSFHIGVKLSVKKKELFIK